MRTLSLFVIGVSAILSDSAAAATRPINNLSSLNNVAGGQPGSLCQKNGGKLYANDNQDISGGVKNNRDRKGGLRPVDCKVDCKSDGTCSGTTPSRIEAGMGIRQVLNNGMSVATTLPGSGASAMPGNILDVGAGFFAQRPSPAGRPVQPKPGAGPQIQ